MAQEVRYKGEKFQFPLGVRTINKIFRSYADSPIDVNKIVEKAVKDTGMNDFGDEFFLRPLNILVGEINQRTQFHALGRFLYGKKIYVNLVNRLWARYWIKEHPEITNELPPSVLITGLQRTGTTFLQRLLGSLPEFRGIYSWEIVNPVPKSRGKKSNGKMQARVFHTMLNYINPEFKSIHTVTHDSLEEEVVLLDHAFMSTATSAALNVPEFCNWLETIDHTKAYEDLKMWIQLLLWRKPAQNYLLLKSPHHMEFLDSFMGVFPKTKIIQTHRNPVETLASYCSMVHFGKKIFCPISDAHQIGDYWLRKDKRLLDHCTAYRAQNPEVFLDVAYKKLVGQPIDTAKMIYEHLGLEWTDQHTTKAEEFCLNNRKNRHGRHSYTLEDFGLEASLVQDTFKEYLNAYEKYIEETE